jgi:leucyl aminopeptidase
MDYDLKRIPLNQLDTNALLLGFYTDHQLSARAAVLDEILGGLFSRLLQRDELEGKPGETLLINHLPEGQIDRVILVGLGKAEELNATTYRKALTAGLKALKDSGAATAHSHLHEAEVKDVDLAWKIRQSVEILESTLYQFNRLKTENPAKPPKLTEFHFLLGEEDADETAKLGLSQGLAIAHGVSLARDLANLPGNLCTPRYLADQAEKLAKQHKKLKAKILDEDEIEKLGMGSFLSVSRGSRQPPRFIILEYQGAGAKTRPHVLVGKGLTFDSGGISIKPSANMDEMKYDMCGGASVIAALGAVAELGLKLNVVGLVPASENLPDGDANKPGDVVTSMAGLTIEILNTDAEGRLILCDALTYAKRFDPQSVIDVATLTGACIVALGRHPSGLMGNDEPLIDAIGKAADTSCDRVWRLPLWEDYQEQLKTNFADIANIGGPDGGSITAGCFLSRFAKEYPWAHLDIAGTAWKTGVDKGATGRPVPLLVQYLIDQAV